MKFINNRAAAFSAAGALVAGSLFSGAMLAPANALDTSYTCQGLSGLLDPIPVSVDSPFDASYASGSQVPAEVFEMTANVPATIVGLVDQLDGVTGNLTTLGATINGLALTLVPQGGGTSKVVPVTAAAPDTTVTLGSPLALPVTGSTGTFTAPAPGIYDVTLPVGDSTTVPVTPGFGFFPKANGSAISGIPLSGLPCALTPSAESVIGTVTVTEAAAKESSTTRAKLLNSPVNVGERAKYRVKVADESGDPATGTVVAKKGTKVLAKGTLTDGKKVLRLPKLRKGSHTIVFKYKGNSTTEASKVTKTLRVYR